MTDKTKRPYLVNSGRNYYRLTMATTAVEACKVMNGAKGVKATPLRKGRVHEVLLTDRARAKMKKNGLNDTQEFRAGYIARRVDSKGRVVYRWGGVRKCRSLAEARRHAERWAAEGERAYVSEHWYDGAATRALGRFFGGL